jgi:RNA polymerase sigma-70 factor (ECF subfamily)
MSQITKEKFLEIHSLYKNRLYAASEKIVKDHHRAEDVIQDVFLRLQKQDFSKIESYISEWLFTVCRNCSIKQYHKRNRYVLVDDIEELDCIDESASAPQEMMQAELVKVVNRLTKKLSKNQQKALKLKFNKDCSYAEIAKKLKTTTGNVGFMLSTAISKIKNLLDKENTKKGYY